ncbi:Pyruvate-flavodoxin oxidoreductase [Giardia muris]|uniref:Pyruvate-flavodoxin oxidoreductase n=1 Tax=Giardia muris TaxID=5742 RepID=A0A3S5GR54_GIAMU|nr:Pyruvate-flavodoxin oxidoreductase [Giardia muris]TNJ29398.1 Pyruvate-flavodoxin oxidoreductase [Giardia muris]|eukprot:TNJ29398.1 Pyruvate-flavodoxin oxidoreductase [Giardia muris]
MPKATPVDGNCAVAHVSYFFSDAALIFPITPSSPMAEYVDSWAAQGRKNGFGQILRVEELNSEGGAAGALHGALSTGVLATTYTASQGLLLMVPNMYKLAGEHLPAVLHVAARTLATHSLSVHGDHSDLMAIRQTGCAIIVSEDVQQAADMAIAAHLTAINASHPVVNAFDGFRTSHTIKKIELVDYSELEPHLPHDAIERFRKSSLNPEHPHMRGSCQGPPVWMQAGEADNMHYDKVISHFEESLGVVEKITGRKYACFEYTGAPDATSVIVIMGSGYLTVCEAVEHLVAKGEKVGVVCVRLFRPFSPERLATAIPRTATRICVMDRSKEITACAEALRLDVVSSLQMTGRLSGVVHIIGGRYGLSSKDFNTADVFAIFKNLQRVKPLDRFTVGITDDVTHLSLPRDPCSPSLVPPGTVQCIFYGMGSDGVVGANKNAIKIIADNTPLYAQGYFDYDSFKAGGFTAAHLRFGPQPIRCEYFICDADYTAVSQPSYFNKYSGLLVERCKPNSILLLNTPARTLEEVTAVIPKAMRQMIEERSLQLKVMDASAIALEAGLPGRINSAMQAAFFLLSGVLPSEEAIKIWRDTIVKTFKRKGEKVVNQNLACVDATLKPGAIASIDYPRNWASFEEGPGVKYYNERLGKILSTAPEFVKDVVLPVSLGRGDALPVSKFERNGFMMTGTTKFTKRGVAVRVPIWQSSTCIQCMLCVTACPHAVIRPYLIDSSEEGRLCASVQEAMIDAKNPVVKRHGSYKLVLQASPLDCTGCSLCYQVCPTKDKGTLRMEVLHHVEQTEAAKFDSLSSIVTPKTEDWSIDDRVAAYQFREPLFEYHGACAGCGETAYITHITRLFGDRLIIANATGCSSIYGFSYPYSPFTKNSKGHGPAWANSLFEDNAEFGLGMLVGIQQRRQRVLDVVKGMIEKGLGGDEFLAAARDWVANYSKIVESETTGLVLAEQIKALQGSDVAEQKALLGQASSLDLLAKPLILIMGGDGWAYDIGFAGLDQVLASGLDVTIFVLDTEVYSNTGGQRSKATPLSAVARFAASGKRTEKKDMGLIAMSYEDTYVASISLGSSHAHAIKSIREAFEWEGPSIILAYAPCIEHGESMDQTSAAQKLAVETGYWLTYTRHPKTGLKMVGAAPSKPVKEFLGRQNRFKQLVSERSAIAEELHDELQKFIDDRYKKYTDLAASSKKE